MISRIRGTLLTRELDRVEVMTPGGVAYELEIPQSVYERLPPEGEDVGLRTYQVVREDALILFGFMEEAERQLFGRLLGASGVGPRLALAMLSTLSAERLVRAIRERDTAALRQVSGIGKKTAERIAFDLSDKLDDLAFAGAEAAPAGQTAQAAVSALVALGYSSSEAGAAVRQALDEEGDLQGPALIKAALARAGGS